MGDVLCCLSERGEVGVWARAKCTQTALLGWDVKGKVHTVTPELSKVVWSRVLSRTVL